MADYDPEERRAFNVQTVEEFRANAGKVGGVLEGMNLILVHTIGARTGQERIIPLGCAVHSDGRYRIVGSDGGNPKDPDWVRNLRAHPRVTVEVGTETFTVLAEEPVGAEYDEVWGQMLAASSGLRSFAAEAGRPVPVFLLRRED